MTKGSFMSALALLQHFAAIGSAASDRNHDLQRVAVGERRLRETAARDDFAVAFHRHALARELQTIEQGRDIGIGLEAPGGAVNIDFNHCRNLCEQADSAAIGLHCKCIPSFHGAFARPRIPHPKEADFTTIRVIGHHGTAGTRT